MPFFLSFGTVCLYLLRFLLSFCIKGIILLPPLIKIERRLIICSGGYRNSEGAGDGGFRWLPVLYMISQTFQKVTQKADILYNRLRNWLIYVPVTHVSRISRYLEKPSPITSSVIGQVIHSLGLPPRGWFPFWLH